MLSKEELRTQVWRLMEEKGIASFPKPVYNRIPNFIGAYEAAQNLRTVPEYKSAKIVFCNPDSPQKPVREIALQEGKIVVMATPRLKHGFLIIDPTNIPPKQLSEASTIVGAFRYGLSAKPREVKIDLFVAGSVAVALDGGRLGKGTGYSDQEYDILKKSGGIEVQTRVITTVHDIQILPHIPTDLWDISVDIITTPTQIIRTKQKQILSQLDTQENKDLTK